MRPITEKDNEDFRRFITSPEEFDRQLQYLKEHGFTVVSLKDVVAHLASSSPFRGKYVAITFDDGYQSQYHYALPILKKYNDTATFFVYTDAVDRLKQTMTWDEIIDLDSQGMTIAAHTRTHPLLTKIHNKDQLSQEIYGSKEDLETHLHKSVTLFAYPYGKYNDAIIAEVKNDGYIGAVGVNMGHLQTKEQLYTLKRYNVNDNDLEFQKLF